MTRHSFRSTSLFAGLGAVLALTGCPGSSETTHPDAAHPADAAMGNDAFVVPMVDAGHDAATVDIDAAVLPDTGIPTDPDTGTDAAVVDVDANLAPDMGLAGTWDNCAQAVVFGSEGEGCAFTGSCVECVLTPTPRQALCMSGRLRVTAAGAGACASTPDAGMVGFPDTGPRLDAGMGVDGGACNAFAIATPTTPACPMSVVDCIRADPSMLSACVSANAACLGCAQQDIQACATQTGGCDDEVGRARCCFDANCPDGSCSTTTCAAQWTAYTTCVQGTTCNVSNACFPVPVDCQPLGWAAPTAVSCTNATLTCINAATTGAQVTSCLHADTTAPADSCFGCWNDGLISCVTDNGLCTQNLGDAQCCFDAACPTGDATCINASVAPGGACEATWDGFFACVNDAIGTLPDGACTELDACFP